MTFAPPLDDLAHLPLNALDAVSFDIETTGLDPKRARAIEIAAIRIRLGKASESETFSSLINPGVSIPASATSIHGINDRDVADAPGFQQVVQDFARWAGPSIFISYGSDFDLAVLRAEHARLGMLWSPFQTIDVLPLVPLAGLNLSNFGLETVAAELGIDTSDRHRALADAIMTAKVFTVLIPQLKKAGVTTLTEAQRACARSPQIKQSLRQDAVAKPAELTGMDSFPFRQRVRDVMTSPPEVIKAQETMSAAIARMAGKGVSSLIVRNPGDPGLGILTAGDVLNAISKHGGGTLSMSVGECCSRTLRTVTDREFLYRAIVEMKNRRVRHLGVVDGNGALVGVITGRDLFNKQGKDAIALGSGIQSARSASELARIWSDLSTVAKALARQAVDARHISAIISRELRAMTKRACELCEQEIGPPPAEYAMLVLGSAGRGESLLAMDQDNAIVMADSAGEDSGSWHAELARRASAMLDEAGVRFCDGGIMASNSDWRKDVTDWNRTVRKWLSRTGGSDILNADIFFDAMWVHGDFQLASAMYRSALEDARKSRPFLRLLARRACEFDCPTGFLGRWRLDKNGRVDLKKSGIMPIFSAARAVALEHGIQHRSTLRRLNALTELRPEFADTCHDLLSAHSVILGAILNQQLRDIDRGIPLSNSAAPADLDRIETQQLKWALGRVPQVTAVLGVPA